MKINQIRKVAVIFVSILAVASFALVGYDKALDKFIALLPKESRKCFEDKLSMGAEAQNVCTGATDNSVATWTQGGKLQDTTTFFYDSTNERVGVGTSTPGAKFEVTNGYLRALNGSNTYPTTGMGVEIVATSGIGYVQSFDRTAGTFQRLQLNGNPVVVMNGYMGVGTTAPARPLQVVSASDIRVGQFAGALSDVGVQLANTAAGGRIWTLFSSSNTSGIGAGNFGIYDDTAALTRLSINSSGNVGIATTAPGAKLDVNGTFRFDSVDCINAFCPPNQAIRLTPNLHLNSNAGNAVIVNWDNGTTGATQTFRVGNGAAADAWYVTGAGTTHQTGGLVIDGSTVIDDGAGWHRSYGQTGWFNGTYGGGMYMIDTTYVRTYGGKKFYVDNEIRSSNSVNANGLTEAVGGAGGMNSAYYHVSNGYGTGSTDTWLPYPGNGWNYLRGPTYAFNGNWIDENNTGYNVDPNNSSSLNTLYGAQINTTGATFLRLSGNGIVSVQNGANYFFELQYGGPNDVRIGGATTRNLYVTGTVFGNNPSDRRIKKNIEPLSNGLSKVEQLKPVTFQWQDPSQFKEEKGQQQDGTYMGFIAQDVEEVFPAWIDENSKGWKVMKDNGVVRNEMFALIVQAVKELHVKLESVISMQSKQDQLIKKQQELLEKQQKQLEALQQKVEKLEKSK